MEAMDQPQLDYYHHHIQTEYHFFPICYFHLLIRHQYEYIHPHSLHLRRGTQWVPLVFQITYHHCWYKRDGIISWCYGSNKIKFWTYINFLLFDAYLLELVETSFCWFFVVTRPIISPIQTITRQTIAPAKYFVDFDIDMLLECCWIVSQYLTISQSLHIFWWNYCL